MKKYIVTLANMPQNQIVCINNHIAVGSLFEVGESITDKYICINWNSFMSSFVNMLRVKQIASYLRKFTSLPIYDAYCNVY